MLSKVYLRNHRVTRGDTPRRLKQRWLWMLVAKLFWCYVMDGWSISAYGFIWRAHGWNWMALHGMDIAWRGISVCCCQHWIQLRQLTVN